MNLPKHTIFIILLLFSSACNKSGEILSECNATNNLLKEFTDPDGNNFLVYDDGSVYENGTCEFIDNVFTPGFEEGLYMEDQGKTFIISDDGARYETIRSFKEDFENRADWRDLFIQDLQDRNRFMTNLTLQSPVAKTKDEHHELRDCLLAQMCDFIDNKIEITKDPMDLNNTVLKFHSVAPSADMVTAKCSVNSSALYFPAGQDFWYRARYYVEKGMPLTIVDFESSHLNRWGPRALIKNDDLVVENKFFEKIVYDQNQDRTYSFPTNQWVTLTVHFLYDDTNGIIQIWQDGKLIIDHIGNNIPLNNWVQDVLEIGITATSEETILYVDDIEFRPDKL